jgi:transposase, IS5 family
MRQTKKGNVWYFGMKVHVGTDKQGLVHSILTTDAAQADINQLPELIHGDERELYGDGAYWREADRQSFREVGVRYRVNRRGPRTKLLNASWKRLNQTRSSVRAMGERGEAALGLQQGALPRPREEHRAGVRGVRTGNPVHG